MTQYKQLDVPVTEIATSDRVLRFVPWTDRRSLGFEIQDLGAKERVFVSLIPDWGGTAGPAGFSLQVSKEPDDVDGAEVNEQYAVFESAKTERWIVEANWGDGNVRHFFNSKMEAERAVVSEVLSGHVSQFQVRIKQIGVLK